MFTGLIETTGRIVTVTRQSQSLRFGIQPTSGELPVSIGDSVAISGVCLTVESSERNMLFFTAVFETLNRSTLLAARTGDIVNMERSLRIGGRVEGHFVLGHVDCVATIVDDRWFGDSLSRAISFPDDFSPFIARKGSIAVDGISLTIAEKKENCFTIALIPHTLRNTTMEKKKSGDTVNLECDVLSRYIGEHLKIQTMKRSEPTTSTHEHHAARHPLDCGDATLITLLEQGGF